MCKWLLIVLCFCHLNMVAAQDKKLPEEATAFLIPGYEVLDYITGDLNADKRQDAILVLKENGEDTAYDEAKRPFLLLIRQADGKLKLVKRNDEVILCRQCGGALGDPYENIDISNNGFDIRFYGGSAWRWGAEYFFRYNVLKANWFLTGEKQFSYHNLDIERTMKEVTIDAVELGVVAIDFFNGNPGFMQHQWKVVAAKTFFYRNPKKGSKPRKGYLVKGDTVTSYREYINFVEVNFENKKEQASSGFILKKDLVKID